MPVLRYFVVAGAGLLALLFVANAWLPAPVVAERYASTVDKTTIRITGDKHMAERVTIDTSLPTITPPVAPMSVVESSVTKNDAQTDSKRDALARMENDSSAASVVKPDAPAKKAALRKYPRRPVVAMERPAAFFHVW